MRHGLKRRDFLAQMGFGAAASFLAPSFDSVLSAAMGAVPTKPKRLVVVGSGNGVTYLSQVLGPIRNVAKGNIGLRVVRELHNPAVQLYIHGYLIGQYTCGGGVSIDTVIGQSHKETAFATLPFGATLGGEAIYRAPTLTRTQSGQAVPLTLPEDILRKVFVGQDASVSLDKRVLTLDTIVSAESRSLVAKLAPSERYIVQEHLAGVEELINRYKALERDGLCKAPPFSDPELAQGTNGGTKIPAGKYEEVIDFQIDAIVAAFACGTSATATLGMEPYVSRLVYKFLPTKNSAKNMDHHDLCHAVGSSTAQQMLQAVEQFHAEKIAKLMTKLAATKTGTGTLADETVIAWVPSGGSRHHGGGARSFAVLVGGGVKNGADVGKKRPMRDLWVSVANGLGVPIGPEGFGSGPFSGVIPDLFTTG